MIDSEIKDITAYLAASVLADKVSGPPQNPGGSLWSRLNSSDDHPSQDDHIPAPKVVHPHSIPAAHNRQSPNPLTSHSPPRQVGSRRSREADIFKCLADIETEVDALRHEASNRLTHQDRPSSSGPPTPFPHGELLALSKDLKSRLDVITFKGPAVLELKNSILSKLQTIEHKVTAAKKVWKEELSNIKTAKTPQYGLPYETGNLSFEYFTH